MLRNTLTSSKGGGAEAASTGTTLGSKVFRVLMSFILVIGLMPAITLPETAYADTTDSDWAGYQAMLDAGTDISEYLYGAISVTSEDATDNTIELTVGETATITIYPYQHVQYEGCRMYDPSTYGTYTCPSVCGGIGSCWTAYGCSCETTPTLVTATVTTTNSNSDAVTVSEATATETLTASTDTLGEKSTATVTITAEAVGTSTVTVSVDGLYFWTPVDSQTYTVNVVAADDGITYVDGIYYIDCEEDLYEFADIVNGYTDEDGNAVAADPDAYGVITKSFELESGILPAIGTSSTDGFQGTLDGGGYTISGVTGITKYAFVTYLIGGTIKDLTIEGAMGSLEEGTTYSVYSVFVYQANSGTISGCTSDVDIYTTSYGSPFVYLAYTLSSNGDVLTIENCVNYGDIYSTKAISSSANAAGIGGIIAGTKAKNNGTINIVNCANYGDITAQNAGGIMGSAYMSTTGGTVNITGCVNEGDILSLKNCGGGIIGTTGYSSSYTKASINITDCYNAGDIEMNSSVTATSGIGGIIGAQAAYSTSKTTAITNCFNSGTLTYEGTGTACYIGAIAGYSGTSSARAATYDNVYYLEGVASTALGYTTEYYNGDYPTSVTASELHFLENSLNTSDETTTSDDESTETTDTWQAGCSSGHPVLSWQTGSSHAYSTDAVAFTWSDDGQSATAAALCTNTDDCYIDVDVTMSEEVLVDETCTTDGTSNFTASATLPDSSGTVTNTNSNVTVPATGHDYSAAFTWAADYSSATVVVSCSRGDLVSDAIEATVTSETDGSNTVYTATVEYDGIEYTEVQTVTALESIDIYAWRESSYGEAPNEEASTDGCHITAELTFDDAVTITDEESLIASIAIGSYTIESVSVSEDDPNVLVVQLSLPGALTAGVVTVAATAESGILSGVTVGDSKYVQLESFTTIVDTGLSFELVEVVAGTADTPATTTIRVATSANVRSMNHVIWFSTAGSEDGTGSAILENSGSYSQSTTAHHHGFYSMTLEDSAAIIVSNATDTLAEAGYTVTDNGDGTFTITATEAVEGEILWAESYSNALFNETGIGYGETMTGVTAPETQEADETTLVTSALASEIARYANLTESDYSQHSWYLYEVAYAEAVDALELAEAGDESLVQSDVNTATSALYYAYKALIDADSASLDEHDFGDAVWTWADDYTSATATFTCETCDYEYTIDATLTSVIEDGVATVTASVELLDETYTDVQTVAASVLSEIDIYAWRESSYGEAPNEEASTSGCHITAEISFGGTLTITDEEALIDSITIGSYTIESVSVSEDDSNVLVVQLSLPGALTAGVVAISAASDSGILSGITVTDEDGNESFAAIESFTTIVDTGLSFELVEVVAGTADTPATTTIRVATSANVRSMNHVIWFSTAGSEDGTGSAILENSGSYSQSTTAHHHAFYSFTLEDSAAIIVSNATDTLAEAGYTVTDNGDGTFTITATTAVEGEILWAESYSNALFNETGIGYGETMTGVTAPEAQEADTTTVTTSALASEIARYANLAESDYTQHTWAVYIDAYEAATATLATESATQDDVNSATSALYYAYKALIDAEDGDELDTHDFGEAVWTWSDDYTSATATFTCETCDYEYTLEATVEVTYAADGETYTATVELLGETYTDVATIDYTITRIAGSGRYATAALEALEAYDSADTVILATGENYADALSASSLAGALDAPVLLTKTAALSDEAAAAIEALGATNVIVVGGTGAVSADVVSALEASGLTVTRIAGSNRYQTAEEIYYYGLASGLWGDQVIIASGTGYADALSVSSLAYAEAYPILLANKDGELTEASEAIVEYASASGIVSGAIITGGTSVVSEDTETALADLFGDAAIRLAGSNRYLTSVAIAEYAVENGYLTWDGATVATGDNYPDALAGSALAGTNGSVLLLVNDKNVEVLTAALAAVADQIDSVYVLGGTGAVSDEVKDAVATALAWDGYAYVIIDAIEASTEE